MYNIQLSGKYSNDMSHPEQSEWLMFMFTLAGISKLRRPRRARIAVVASPVAILPAIAAAISSGAGFSSLWLS